MQGGSGYIWVPIRPQAGDAIASMEGETSGRMAGRSRRRGRDGEPDRERAIGSKMRSEESGGKVAAGGECDREIKEWRVEEGEKERWGLVERGKEGRKPGNAHYGGLQLWYFRLRKQKCT